MSFDRIRSNENRKAHAMTNNPVVTFFPVGNGDTTLIEFHDALKTCVLVDVHIGNSSNGESETDRFDVRSDLLRRLPHDSDGRPYLDLFVLTHADQDHVSGLSELFHLGDPEDYPKPAKGEKPKILVREIWCSSRFRNIASESNSLTEDAKAFNTEARRRENLLLDGDFRSENEGNLLRVIGDAGVDRDGFPSNKESHVGDVIDTFGGHFRSSFIALVIGPVAKQENESEKDYYGTKNRTGIILQFSFTRKTSSSLSDYSSTYNNQLLLGDDNEVATWRIVAGQPALKPYVDALDYDILLAPHHGSWHVFSDDSATECEDPQPDPDAVINLSHSKNEGSFIVVSSKSDEDEDDQSKLKGRELSREVYRQFVQSENLLCTGDSKTSGRPVPMSFELTPSGPRRVPTAPVPPTTLASHRSSGQAYAHG